VGADHRHHLAELAAGEALSDFDHGRMKAPVEADGELAAALARRARTISVETPEIIWVDKPINRGNRLEFLRAEACVFLSLPVGKEGIPIGALKRRVWRLTVHTRGLSSRMDVCHDQ